MGHWEGDMLVSKLYFNIGGTLYLEDWFIEREKFGNVREKTVAGVISLVVYMGFDSGR